MRSSVFGIFLCLVGLTAFGQKSVPFASNTFDETTARLHHWNLSIPVNFNADTIEAILLKQIPYLKQTHNNLILKREKHSPYTSHYTYIQTFCGIEIRAAEIQVNVSKEGRILSVFDRSWSTQNWKILNYSILRPDFSSNAALNVRLNELFPEWHVELQQLVLLPQSDGYIPAYCCKYYDGARRFEEWLYNRDTIFMIRDLNTYSGDTASAFVFNPDPLTSAGVEYGSPFVDDNDTDLSILNDERKSVKIYCNFDGLMYSLENPYVKIIDYDLPVVAPATSASPLFDFGRGEDGFEDVNAFYHISKMNYHIQNLGYDLMNMQVMVDAHGGSGGDNSFFTAISLVPHLNFGIGGVDDAEDADVIIHEYAHALSWDANGNNSSGSSQRQALDEGWGDYLASSYSKSISDYRWDDVFTWDGHNEFWAGRSSNTDARYPDDLSGSIHISGQIYSSALMDIYELLGQDVTDRLAIQSLYSWSAGMNIKQAGAILLESDSLLYDGIHFCIIYNALLEHGLTDSMDVECLLYDPAIACEAGEDVLICLGDSVQIGGEAEIGFYYRWTPSNGLSDPNSANPFASPDETTVYSIQAIREDGSAYDFDELTVSVGTCSEVPVLFNTDAFSRSESAAVLELPADLIDAQVAIFDIRGRLLYDLGSGNRLVYIYPQDEWSSGLYMLRITFDKERYQFKLIKW